MIRPSSCLRCLVERLTDNLSEVMVELLSVPPCALHDGDCLEHRVNSSHGASAEHSLSCFALCDCLL